MNQNANNRAHPWQHFWNNYLDHAPITEDDLFKQVAQTVNKKPIQREKFIQICERIAGQLQLSPQDHLLELCCGNGLFSYELAPYVGRLTGVDFAPNLIRAAQQIKSRENIIYALGDATASLSALIGDGMFPNKFLINNSLAYFKPADLNIILRNILNLLGNRHFAFLITGIPNFDLKWNFYNTPERCARHMENEANSENTNDGLGRWWRASEIQDVCRQHGLSVLIENQPSDLSNYRMDALISTTSGTPQAFDKKRTQTVRVLIFPCGAENALELHDALANCVNIEVWGATGEERHGWHVFRNYVSDVPFIQEEGFVSAINQLLRKEKIDVLFPTHDTVADFFANHRDKIECRIIMGDNETVNICREKLRIYRHFEDCPFTPRIYKKLEDVDKYPVFLKPNIGEGGNKARRAQTRVEVAYAIASEPDLLIVEYLPGEELTIDCFTDRHGVLRFVGPRTRSRIFSGISVNSKTVPLTDEIRAMADEINRRLRFRGLWFFQIKRADDGRFKLMEVCTRAAGTMCVHRQRGVNFALLSVYDAMDMDIEILVNDFSVEVDRALINRFKLGIDYDTIYLDFDDTLICRGEVNCQVLQLLYQAVRQGKAVNLLTRHEGDIHKKLDQVKIHPGLFKTIQKLGWNEEKFKMMPPGERAIFIDNAFAERKKVKSQTGMPVFDVDAVPSLLDWRT